MLFTFHLHPNRYVTFCDIDTSVPMWTKIWQNIGFLYGTSKWLEIAYLSLSVQPPACYIVFADCWVIEKLKKSTLRGRWLGLTGLDSLRPCWVMMPLLRSVSRLVVIARPWLRCLFRSWRTASAGMAPIMALSFNWLAPDQMADCSPADSNRNLIEWVVLA